MVNVSRVFLLYPIAMVARDVFILDVAMVNPLVVFVLANLLRLEDHNFVASTFLKPITTTSVIFSHAVSVTDVRSTTCMWHELVTTIVVLVKNFVIYFVRHNLRSQKVSSCHRLVEQKSCPMPCESARLLLEHLLRLAENDRLRCETLRQDCQN